MATSFSFPTIEPMGRAALAELRDILVTTRLGRELSGYFEDTSPI